jgi:hypothetical protein
MVKWTFRFSRRTEPGFFTQTKAAFKADLKTLIKFIVGIDIMATFVMIMMFNMCG